MRMTFRGEIPWESLIFLRNCNEFLAFYDCPGVRQNIRISNDLYWFPVIPTRTSVGFNDSRKKSKRVSSFLRIVQVSKEYFNADDLSGWDSLGIVDFPKELQRIPCLLRLPRGSAEHKDFQ